MVKKKLLLLFTSLESSSGPFVCKLLTVTATDPGYHSDPRLFQVRGASLNSILIHFLEISNTH